MKVADLFAMIKGQNLIAFISSEFCLTLQLFKSIFVDAIRDYTINKKILFLDSKRYFLIAYFVKLWKTVIIAFKFCFCALDNEI